ncbi:uncharacterized protein [Epargyreus clarus]|uniref:uncharacterized protein n=1 Tax=Epargyreus clarus TaxID=520877 RepID=UPI003C2C09D1
MYKKRLSQYNLEAKSTNLLAAKSSQNAKVIKRSICGSDEVRVECYHCGPKTCQDLGHPMTCKGIMGSCRSECVCTDGYVRDSSEKCILKKECSSCGGDRNATTGCGNHCSNRCSDYRDVNKTCMSGCRYNSCDCKTGYVYNDRMGVCVLPIDCYCPPNEVYYKCSLEKCYEYCSELGVPKACPALAPNCTAPACMCDQRMLRNKTGVCVPESECD